MSNLMRLRFMSFALLALALQASYGQDKEPPTEPEDSGVDSRVRLVREPGGHAGMTSALVFTPDGKKLAIEWDWGITRKKDGKRGVSHDAIIVDLVGGKIASWREYYDPAASGEANP